MLIPAIPFVLAFTDLSASPRGIFFDGYSFNCMTQRKDTNYTTGKRQVSVWLPNDLVDRLHLSTACLSQAYGYKVTLSTFLESAVAKYCTEAEEICKQGPFAEPEAPADEKPVKLTMYLAQYVDERLAEIETGLKRLDALEARLEAHELKDRSLVNELQAAFKSLAAITT